MSGGNGEVAISGPGSVDVAGDRHSADALARSEVRYRHLFESSLVPLFEQDLAAVIERFALLRAEGVNDLAAHVAAHPDEVDLLADLVRFVSVNPAGLRLARVHTKAEWQAGFVDGVRSGRNRAPFIEQLLAVWAGEPCFEGEITGYSPDGSAVDLILSWAIPEDQDPSDPGPIVVSVVDITEQRTRERLKTREERHLRAVIEGAPVGMALASADGSLLLVNKALGRILDLPREDINGRHWGLLLGSQPSAESSGLLDQVASGVTMDVAFESRLTTDGGTETFIRVGVSALPTEQHGLPSFVIQVIDQTEQKAAQRLREETLESRNRLVSSLAHALRTPLTAVVGFSQQVWQGREHLSEFEVNELLGEIYNGSLEVSQLIDDLVVLERFQADSLNPCPEEVDVAATATKALGEIPGRDSLDWFFEGEATALVDRRHLSQILRIVMAEAAERAEKQVWVEVSQQGDAIAVAVTHDGRHRQADARALLFEPFGQEGAQGNLSPQPLGLGLPAARVLARANGGDLQFTDGGMGSHLVVRLPQGSAAGEGSTG